MAIVGTVLFFLLRDVIEVQPVEGLRDEQYPAMRHEITPAVYATSIVRCGANAEIAKAGALPQGVALSPCLPPGLPSAPKAAVEKSRLADANAIPDEWIVRLRDGTGLQTFQSRDGLQHDRIADVIPGLNAVRLVGISADEMRGLAKEWSDDFEYSPNFRVGLPRILPSPSIRPVSDQSHMGFNSEAMSWLGITGDHSKWGEGVTVAILDVGVARCEGLREERIVRLDLTGNDTGEVAGANPHATAVAAILAGNIPGREGVAPSSHIISMKVLAGSGLGDSFTLAKGIEEAVSRGARIINICLGSRGDCPLVRQAVDRAIAGGVIIVAAVGNDSAEGVSYPARYDGVVGVTAVDAGGRRLDFANIGPEVDLAAPGLDVWAAASSDSAISLSGTSASVPFVAGALACLFSREPGLKAGEAMDLLLGYSDDAGTPGRDPELGCGILDVRRILDREIKGIHDIAIVDNCVSGSPSGAGQLSLVVSVQNRGTERLSSVLLRVRIGEYGNVESLHDIEVGETVGCRFLMQMDEEGAATGVRVVSEALIPGLRDDNPSNNAKETVFARAIRGKPH